MWGKASSSERGSERLAERRRLRRRRLAIASFIFLLFLLAAVLYGLWQSSVRISEVTVYGADQSFAAYAKDAMQGSYFGIIPRDSTFLFSESDIRSSILAGHPDIAAVSIFRKGFTGLSLKIDYRVPIARWCGLAPTPDVAEYCYIFDANGTIFSVATTTTETLNTFSLYAPLEGSGLEPLHASIAHAGELPSLFDFARQLDTFGSPVSHVVLRDDEVDDILESGTRITYVLGHEQSAFAALVSARDTLNLTNASIEYVDLRFDGKVYVKRKEQTE
ncbi:MAG: hypothetical protein PHV99_00365 [Candidatus Pacebacteria bacterium]|nr:hypothetical protein [Candidatus Paceibacterota bacterium]